MAQPVPVIFSEALNVSELHRLYPAYLLAPVVIIFLAVAVCVNRVGELF